MPKEVRERLRKIEWVNSANFRGRLDGSRSFPIDLPLKPPTGPEALKALGRYGDFVNAWRDEPDQSVIRWVDLELRSMPGQKVPDRIVLKDMEALSAFLGTSEKQRHLGVASIIARFGELGDGYRRAALHNIGSLESLTPITINILTAVLPQLRRGMGTGRYLRSVAVHGVDTKFIERNDAVIFAMLKTASGEAPTEASNLQEWLGVIPKPQDWLIVRPLCPALQKHFHGLRSFRTSTDSLVRMDLPVRAVLVVENEESIFTLPELEGVVAIGGGGKNLKWLEASWTEHLPIGYWGDMDTWGYGCLADARKIRSQVVSLMMDLECMIKHRWEGLEPTPNPTDPSVWLSEMELVAYRALLSGTATRRFEQEFLDQDEIYNSARTWFERFVQ